MHKVRRGRGKQKLYLGFERAEHLSTALLPSFGMAERVTAGWLSRLAAFSLPNSGQPKLEYHPHCCAAMRRRRATKADPDRFESAGFPRGYR
jgi:hypothetical protein